MKLQEGPAFGAGIIGFGVGFLVWQKTRNLVWAIGIGIALAIADYIFLIFVKKVFGK